MSDMCKDHQINHRDEQIIFRKDDCPYCQLAAANDRIKILEKVVNDCCMKKPQEMNNQNAIIMELHDELAAANERNAELEAENQLLRRNYYTASEVVEEKKQTAQAIIQYIIDQGTIEIRGGEEYCYYINANDIDIFKVKYGIGEKP
jgi:uncharacterized protein YaiL (DUF2058 family)